MAPRQAGFNLPASSGGFLVSFFQAIGSAICSRRAQAARAEKRVWCCAAVGAFLLLAASILAHAQSVTFDHVQLTVPAGGLNTPSAVAVDAAGNVFIADTFHNRVVEVPWNGTSYGAQLTVPASGLYYPSGVAVDGAGNVFIADHGHHRVVEVPWNGTSYGAQTTLPVSGLGGAIGVAVDKAGDVFIADDNYAQVVKVPWNGTKFGDPITVPTPGFNQNDTYLTQGLAVDGAGNVFIADQGPNVVWEVPWNSTTSSYGAMVKVPTGFVQPDGVAVDGAGNVFISDNYAGQVVEVPWNGTSFGTQIMVAKGEPGAGQLALDGAGNILVSTSNNQVVKLLSGPLPANICPGGQTTPAPCSQVLTAYFNLGADVVFGANPTVLTQGAPNGDFTLGTGVPSPCTGFVKSNASCEVNVKFAPLAPGLRMGAVQLAYHLADSNGNPTGGNLQATGFVGGLGQGPAIAFGPGAQSALTVTAGGGGLSNPAGVAVDAAGDVFIADMGNYRVVKIPAGGGAQTIVGDESFAPQGVAVDGAGNVFVVDSSNYRVVEVPWTGTGYGAQTVLNVTAGGKGLNSPADVAVDGAGNVFIADTNNSRVVKVPAGGGPQITVGTGLLAPGRRHRRTCPSRDTPPPDFRPCPLSWTCRTTV